METSTLQSTNLKEAWTKLKETEPRLRIRDAAKKLQVSEAELLATGIGENVIRLSDDFVDQVKKFPTLGRVMSLCRNEGCVLEHKGSFQKIDIHPAGPSSIATVIGPIEQRLFFHGWKFGFAVSNDTPRGPMFSLQYFDKTGEAVMKVFLQEKSDYDASGKVSWFRPTPRQSKTLSLKSKHMKLQNTPVGRPWIMTLFKVNGKI